MKPGSSMIENIHKALVSKKISCFELTSWYINEIKKSDLNSFITVNEEQAIEDSKKVDEKLSKNEDIGLLRLLGNIECNNRALAERVGLVLVHPNHIHLGSGFIYGSCLSLFLGLLA